MGSYMHKLDHALNEAAAHSESSPSSAGRIMDADFAIESSQMAKNQLCLTPAQPCWVKQRNERLIHYLNRLIS